MLFNRYRVLKILTYTLLILGALVSIIPFLCLISTSLKSIGEALGSSFFPLNLHFENYAEAWKRGNFPQYFWNSIRITGISLVGSLTISVLAAYGFARIKFRDRDLIFGILLATLMIPAMVTIIPNFLTVTWLGRIGPIKWINNLAGINYPLYGICIQHLYARQFFAQIPDELYDAARIDGSGHFRFLLQIVIPLSKASLMVILVLTFIGSWNSLAWPLLVTNTPDWRPISVGMLNFVTKPGSRSILLWQQPLSLSSLS